MFPQRVDAIDIYGDSIAVRKRKIVGGYGSGAGHQIGIGRKAVIAREKFGELKRFALEFG
jgi:hypothetical protein